MSSKKRHVLAMLVAACFALIPTFLTVVPANAAGLSSATPTGLVQTATASTSVTMKWNAVSGAPKYRLQVSTDVSMSGATYHRFSGTTGTVLGLTKATTYFVKVRVITTDGVNLSDYSAAVEAPTTFSTPSSLAVTARTADALTFGWTAVPGAPRYRIQLAKSSGMSGATYHRFWSNGGTISGLDPQTTYFAKIRVISADGLSLSSYSASPVSGKTEEDGSGGLSPPTNLRSTAQSMSMMAFDWDDVATAPAYTLSLSQSPSMTNPVTSTSTASSAQVGGLNAGTTYYARVRVVDAGGTPLSGMSNQVTVKTPSTGFAMLTPSGLDVGTVTSTSVALSWTPVKDAPGYRIQLSKTADMSSATYVRVDSTTRVVDGLDGNSTYYFKVRVIASDGANLSAYSDSVKAVTSVAAVPLKVASYNVRCANCYAGTNSELRWADRRDAVVQNIKSRMPDVIGIQEVSQGWIGGVSLSQFEDLRNRLRSAGTSYDVTDLDRNNCEKSTTPSGCQYKDQGASKGTKVFFNASTVDKVSSGSKVLAQCSGCNERYVAWGIFTHKATGKKFFFADTHLEPGSDKYTVRQSQATTMMAEIARRNVDNLPAFVVGDLNSTRYFSPTNAPYDKVMAGGFVDPLGHTYKSAAISPTATAEKRIRANYNSFNDFSRTVMKYGENQNGSNIDYIFTTPMRTLVWETVLNLDANGMQAGIIPSDHSMLVATVLMP